MTGTNDDLDSAANEEEESDNDVDMDSASVWGATTATPTPAARNCVPEGIRQAHALFLVTHSCYSPRSIEDNR